MRAWSGHSIRTIRRVDVVRQSRWKVRVMAVPSNRPIVMIRARSLRPRCPPPASVAPPFVVAITSYRRRRGFGSSAASTWLSPPPASVRTLATIVGPDLRSLDHDPKRNSAGPSVPRDPWVWLQIDGRYSPDAAGGVQGPVQRPR